MINLKSEYTVFHGSYSSLVTVSGRSGFHHNQLFPKFDRFRKPIRVDRAELKRDPVIKRNR